MVENAYNEDMSKCYDAIVTAGYYDYDAAADAIVHILGHKKKVLELGTGTGLLAEKLIEKGLEVSGFDFSKSMLEIAVRRLGAQVKLYEQDVTDLNLPDSYAAAVSHGGVWVGIEGRDCIDSHITNFERNLEGLRRVAQYLLPKGLLVIGIQHEHKNCSGIALEDGSTYSSKVDFQGDLIYKQHLVEKEGKVLAEQNVVIRRFDEETYSKMIDNVGFGSLGKDQSKKFLVFHKK